MKHIMMSLVFIQSSIFALLLKTVTAVPVETLPQLETVDRVMPDRLSNGYADYQLGVKYDEYPTIVPKKRTALLVNRVIGALKDILDDEEQRSQVPGVFGSNGNLYSDDIRTNDLQRRGHQSALTNSPNKARPYWRCYFNAVTCF